MITFYGWVIYAIIAAGALVVLGGAFWLTARIASDRGYALGALDGYDGAPPARGSRNTTTGEPA